MKTTQNPEAEVAKLRQELDEYRKREEERRRIAEASQLLSHVSALFVSGREFDHAVRTALEHCGAFIGIPRVAVFQYFEDAARLQRTSQWKGDGSETRIDRPQFASEPFSGMLGSLASREPVQIRDVSTLSPEARKTLASYGAEAILAHPIFVGDTFYGFTAAMAEAAPHKWRQADISILRQVSELIGHGIERREAERALQNSLGEADRIRKQHDAILRSTPHGLCLLSSSWTILWANTALGPMFGVDVGSHGDKLDLSFGELFPGKQAFDEWKREALAEVRTSGSDLREVQMVRRDGRQIRCEVSVVRHDPNSTAMGLVATITEVTERYKAEQALRESEGRTRKFVENLPVGVYRSTVGRKGKFVAANPAMARMFGYSSLEEFLKVPVDELYHNKEDQELFSRRLLEHGAVSEMELPLRRRDGTVIWGRNSTNCAYDSDGRILFFDGVIEDITFRKMAQEALRQSEEKMRAILDNITDGIYEVNLLGGLTYVNPAIVRLAGVTIDEMIGRNYRDFMEPAMQESVYEAFNEVFRSGTAHSGLSYELIGANGTIVPVEGSVSLILDNKRKPIGFRGMVRDVTERRKVQASLEEKTRLLERANDNLKRKNAELDEFTYIASHDLQEPLRKLTAFSEFLRKDLGPDLPPRAEKDLGFIVDAATRMQTLVQDLLHLSRAGNSALKRERISLSVCADLALDALALRIEQTGAKIIRDELPEIWGDKTIFTQLYQNLISNALKFNDGKDLTVHLTCEEGENGPILGVKDNGIGIKADFAEKVFQPFKRLHGRDKYEGSGIGLSICRKGVERHGGRIWVESEEGQGAHFRFTVGERQEEREGGGAHAEEEE